MIQFVAKKVAASLLLILSVVAVPSQAQYASDIDIYSGVSGGAAPNVLLVLDTSANWNANIKEDCFYKDNGVTTTVKPSKGQTKGGIEQCALYNVIDALPIGLNDTPNFNIGIMVFNETIVDTGARVVKAFTPLNAAGKIALKALVKNLDANQSPAPTSYALAMHEAYLYFTEAVPYSGQRAGVLPYDPTAFLGTKYALPAGSSCSQGYVIIIANGAPQSDKVSNDAVKLLLAKLGGSTTPITYPSGTVDPKDSDNWTDEYARFLLGQQDATRTLSAKITTYTIAVTGANSDKASYPAIFNGIAKAGGGDFYEASNVGKLTLALGDIFSHMQAVNSVFSSASLPVSVNARGTYLNQVFMGMFRPDADSKPRWRGNLKQYKFNYDPVTDSLFLSDASTPAKSAISGTTGFISPTATSFWSSPSTFWKNQLLGTPATQSDAPDGEVVEKGGVAQSLRTTYGASQDTRNIFTCIACTINTALLSHQFNVDNKAILSTDLGLPLTALPIDRSNLINWVRGTDNAGDENGPAGGVTIRPSVHGDVLHSRPVAVNYGGTTGVVVFYGSNDGTLRAVNGNADIAANTNAGKELWSFIPQEHFSKLNRLRTNGPEVRLSTTSTGSSATPRDYFVDGPIGVYQKVLSDGTNDKVYLYVAMRRGGRILYALDVTDPRIPKFLWKKTQTDIPELGQTWSEPKVAKIRGGKNPIAVINANLAINTNIVVNANTVINTNPVIIMGAGYDSTAEDSATPGTTTMGNAVLVLDAFDGSVLKSFPTTRSVASDVTLVDTDFDGYVDRAYAVDLGGNLYRIDLEKTTSSATTFAIADWGIYKLASLAGGGTRKFFYPPDVVVTPNFSALLLGSGDREKPLAPFSTDAFFTLYDTKTSKGTPPTAFTPITSANLGTVGTSEDQVAGCNIPMSTNGEKIVNAPTSIAGITYFGTNRPSVSTNSCTVSNLGVAKVYSAPLFCQVAASQELKGGGLPPSPVTGTVTVSYTSPLDSRVTLTKRVPFIIGAPNTKASGIEGSKVSPIISPVRKRRYWYIENTR